MTRTTPPTTQPMRLDASSLGELGRALDMTAEFLSLSSPRVRTELAAYLADFHPDTGRDQLIAYLGWRGYDLQRLARHRLPTSSTGTSTAPTTTRQVLS